jgi:hypothetical protein
MAAFFVLMLAQNITNIPVLNPAPGINPSVKIILN